MSGPVSHDQAFHVSVLPNRVVQLRWAPGSRITGPQAAAAMARIDALNGKRRAPLLVVMTDADTPTREAREQFAFPSTASRIALLGQSPVDRVRASIALLPAGVGSPVPTRFFTSEGAALAWLSESNLDERADHHEESR